MQLLEHFKELSLHPANAKQLKGLILQLAIQGKLTAKWREENPDLISGENSAESLLQKIKAEKAQLVKEKKIKKEKELPQISIDEFSNSIPTDWLAVRISDIAILKAGGDLPKNRFDKQKSNNYIIPIYANGEKNKGLYGYTDIPVITEPSITVSGRGTIGYTEIREEPFYPIVRLIVITPIKQLMVLEYLKYSLQTFDFKDTGTSIPQLTVPMVKNKCIVSLPSVAEQKQIVNTVNQLFQEVEQLEQLTAQRVQLKEHFATSALQQLTHEDTQVAWTYLKPHFKAFFNEESNIKQLRESILQLAVQGKLTAKWRAENHELISGENSAQNLLQKIKAEKAQLIKDKKIKKEKPLPEITEDEIPFEIPEGWVWCRLGDVTELITKGSSPKWQGVNYVNEDEGVLFVTSENVGSYKILWNKKKYVEWKFNEIEPRSILKRNDLLMNIVGGSIGRTAIYDCDEVANINQAVTIIRLLPKIDFNYFLHFFNSPTCISYMFDKQVDNARPNLSMGNISKFMIPFASLEEQKAIVESVNSLMAFCDQLEQGITKSKVLKEQWMGAFLKEGL